MSNLIFRNSSTDQLGVCQLTISRHHFLVGATANPPNYDDKKWSTDKGALSWNNFLRNPHFKGQIILKGLLISSFSPKKRTNDFVFTTSTNLFVHFLGEFEGTKKSFRNYLTFRIVCWRVNLTKWQKLYSSKQWPSLLTSWTFLFRCT